MVDFIKYHTEEDEGNIRCLALKNWFPWNPLPIHSYGEGEQDKIVVRTLVLKRPQPVEVVRCDYV